MNRYTRFPLDKTAHNIVRQLGKFRPHIVVIIVVVACVVASHSVLHFIIMIFYALARISVSPTDSAPAAPLSLSSYSSSFYLTSSSRIQPRVAPVRRQHLLFLLLLLL